MQQTLANWFRDTTKRISTWHADASVWFEDIVSTAETRHKEFVLATPERQMVIEQRYVLTHLHTTMEIVWYVLKVLQPSPDLLRIGIAKDLLRRQQTLDTYEKALDWLEIFHTKLVVVIDADSHVEQKEVHRILVDGEFVTKTSRRQ
eukprot:6333278-Amphidinium_carterae.2